MTNHNMPNFFWAYGDPVTKRFFPGTVTLAQPDLSSKPQMGPFQPDPNCRWLKITYMVTEVAKRSTKDLIACAKAAIKRSINDDDAKVLEELVARFEGVPDGH